MISKTKPIVCVIPGDLHLVGTETENYRDAVRTIDEVNGLIRPDFVQFIGDNVQNATGPQFDLFDTLRDRLEVPHFSLVGDHDVENDLRAEGFRRHVGETFGSHSLRGFRFIRLNTQESRPVGMSAEQIGWLADEFDRADEAGERVVIFQHNYPYQIWEEFAGPGIDDWRAIVQTRRVEAIVCGHTHYWQVANDGRNVVIATRSIGDPEGGPAGYVIFYLDDVDMAVGFHPLGERGPIVLVTHPREQLLATYAHHIVRGADRVVVRIWHAAGVKDVRCRVDDGEWVVLEPSGDGHWSCQLAGDRLTRGMHSLEVIAVGLDGAETSKRIDFVVDPTGRYTAVPGVCPVVTETAFC